MYIRIYFDHKPLFLCDEIDETIQPFVHHDDAVFIDELDSHTVKAMIHEMQDASVHAGVFFYPDLAKLKKTFFKKFTVIQAAGGLIVNEKKEILLIFRRGKWDMPKGKVEKGEKLEDCALREVEEETGLIKIELLDTLAVTYHTYHEGTHFILKESHWFTMQVSGEQVLTPQTEEQIHDIRWVKFADLENYTKEFFPSIKDVVETYRTKLSLSGV